MGQTETEPMAYQYRWRLQPIDRLLQPLDGSFDSAILGFEAADRFRATQRQKTGVKNFVASGPLT